MANAPAAPKINAASMTVAAKNTMEFRIKDDNGDFLGPWRPVSGTAITIPHNLPNDTDHYIVLRAAATAAKPYSLERVSKKLPAQMNLASLGIEFDAIAGAFKYNTATGVLSVNSVLPQDILSLGYTKKSKIDISKNGSYWINAASAKDLRPYMDMHDTENEKFAVFVRLHGNANVGATEAIKLTINIKTGEIIASPI